MKNVVNRPSGVFRAMLRLLGLSSLGALILAGIVALRHMLVTPQALESQLPGEAHLYRWKDGYIYYKLLGEPDAPPLVLLHTPGIAASAYEMRGMMQRLARSFRVYAPDLPGFGLSDRPALQYSAELYIQVCHEFLKKEVKQPALLVASRLSCNYAVAVAARAPQLCSALVLISPLALRGEQAGRMLPSAVSELGPLKAVLYPLLVSLSRVAARDPYYYATTHRFGAEHAVMALLAGSLVQDVSNELEKVQQPTLVIWGADALGRLRRSRSGQNELPDSIGPKQAHVELLPEGSLSVHEEQPPRVAEIILRWSEDHVPVASRTLKSNDLSSDNKFARVDVSASGQSMNETPAGEQVAGQAAEQAVQEAAQVEAYCVKCKTKRPMLNAREVTIKNGRVGVQGVCAVCGTQLFRMGRLAPGYPRTPV